MRDRVQDEVGEQQISKLLGFFKLYFNDLVCSFKFCQQSFFRNKCLFGKLAI